jgi:plastocyanin
MRIAVVVAIAAVGAVMLPRIVSSREAVRDVTLVVRNMTYYVDGNATPNPQLRFAAGEQVRLTLRNDDQGMTHDFSVKSWGVATKVVDGKGSDTVTFRVPRGSNGSTTYTCTPHSAMMNGIIVVE